MSDIGEQSKQLIDTLSSQPVNILTVRSLCRDNPGLIASAGLRLKTWCILLLGSDPEDMEQSLLEIEMPSKDCGEQHVLEADVHRTRAELPRMRTPEMREAIHVILQKFCVDHDVQYKQGMNEVPPSFLFSVNSNELILQFIGTGSYFECRIICK